MGRLKFYEAKIYDKEAHLEKSVRVIDYTFKSAISFSRRHVRDLNQVNFDNTDAKNKRRFVLRRVSYIDNL